MLTILAIVWMRMCAKNMVWFMRNAKRRVGGRRKDTHEVAKNEAGDRSEAGRCAAIGPCLTWATIASDYYICWEAGIGLLGREQAIEGFGNMILRYLQSVTARNRSGTVEHAGCSK